MDFNIFDHLIDLPKCDAVHTINISVKSLCVILMYAKIILTEC